MPARLRPAGSMTPPPASTLCWNSAYCSFSSRSIRLRRFAAVVAWSARKLAVTAAMLAAEIARTSRSRMPRGRYLRISAHQPIAGRAHGFDRDITVGLGELAAQVADVHVEDVRPRVVVVTPDRVQDLRAGKDLIRMPHQVRQQLELACREIDAAARAMDLARPEVEAEVADCQRGRVSLPRLTKLGPDPCQQLGEGERLAEVVVRAEIQAGDHVLGLRERRQHDHGH